MVVALIAKNEIRKIVNYRFTYVIAATLLMMIMLNAIASGYKLNLYETHLIGLGDVFMSVGVSTIIFNMTILFTILSLFLGLSSISEERSGGVLNVLLAKPVHRKEVIMGKFLGLCGFVWTLIVISLLLSLLLLAVFFRMPLSFEDTVSRMTAFTILQFANSALSIGLMMLFGVILSSYYNTLLCGATYFYLAWCLDIPSQFNVISGLVPSTLFMRIMDPKVGTTYLLDTNVAFSGWLEGAVPYLLLLALEAVVVVVLSRIIFSLRED
jgi:hypothetical protein